MGARPDQTVILQWCEPHPENGRWVRDREDVVTVPLARGSKTLLVDGREWQEVGLLRGLKLFRPVLPWSVVDE